MCCSKSQNWLIILKSRFWSLPKIRSRLSYISRLVRGITIHHRDEKARKSCEHGPENGKQKFNQTRRGREKGKSARVDCHTSRKKKNNNRDVTLSVLSLGHFISSSFATKEVKPVTYFSSRKKNLEIWKKILKMNGL